VCRAEPVRVLRVDDEVAWVDTGDGERVVSLFGVDGVAPGDYVLVHAGIALARVEPAEAAAILDLLAELVGTGVEEESR
jgi:hydrogenase expression/formation protein HypC